METRPTEHQSETLPGWQLGKNLSSCMIELYDKKLWTDVKFRCKDHGTDERIHAHKTILAARSPVFQAMFFGAFAESKEEVQLEDAGKEIFDLLLRYIYGDTVTLEEDTASELLQMAHLYQVPSLAQHCADFLATKIRPENACEILTLALFYELTSLRDACCTVIDQNAKQVLISDGFMDLKEDVLLYVLKGDTFYADEEEIFHKTEEWAIRRLTQLGLEENGDNIRKILGDLFYQLRLPGMSYEAFVKCTRKKAYMTAEEYMNIADFINGIPDTSVLSNSCVSRQPVNETLIFNINDGEKTNRHSLNNEFDILVSKDVELISFGLFDVEPCFMKEHFVNSDSDDHFLDSSTPISRYTDKLIYIDTYRSWKRSGERRILNYKRTPEIDISKTFCPVIHGFLSISSLNFKHSFELDTSQNKTDGAVYLKQPLQLKKLSSPYTVTIELQYNCCYQYKCDYNLQIRCGESKGSINCKKGHVEVSSRYKHTLLKSIQFRNLANR